MILHSKSEAIYANKLKVNLSYLLNYLISTQSPQNRILLYRQNIDLPDLRGRLQL